MLKKFLKELDGNISLPEVYWLSGLSNDQNMPGRILKVVRSENFTDLLKKGTVSDIATIVRCLYHRSKVKELPILERKLYDSAKKLLEDEISFALDKPVQEVEALLLAKLEPLGLIRDTKHAALSDDFDDEGEEFIGDDEDEDIVDVEEDEDGDSDDGDEE